MHFNLTPEQAAFQQAARGFAREKGRAPCRGDRRARRVSG
jgi:hypothetical protein